MTELLRILILEDNPADAEMAQFELSDAGIAFTAKVVMTEEDFIRELQTHSYDLILSDYDLPKYDGSAALAEANRRCPDIPFILMTGAVSEDRAIQILTNGAKDYVMKHRLAQRLAPAVKRAVTEAEQIRARKRSEDELQKAHAELEAKVKERTAALEAEIEERKRLEEELRLSASQERKRAHELTVLLETIPVPIFITHDPDAVHTTGNPAADKLLRNPPGGEASLDAPDHVKPRQFKAFKDGRQLSNEELPSQRATRGQRVRDFDFRLVFDDGATRDVTADAAPLLDEKGQSRGSVLVLADITARKRTEEALRRAAEILTQVNDAIIAVDLEGRITFWNKGAERLFGYVDEEAIGRPVTDLYFEDDLPVLQEQVIAPTLAAGQHEIDARGRHKSGQPTFVRLSLSVLRDENGSRCGLIGYSVDISKRIKAEEALNESEKRYRTLFDSMTEGFALHEIVTDAQGRPVDYRFLDVNPAFERLTGLKRADLLGKRVLEVMPGTEVHWIESYGRVALTGEPVHFERHSEGLGRWYEVFAYQTAPRQFAVVFMDITERKRAEAALLENAERQRLVEVAAAEKQRFLEVLETLPTMICLLTPDYHVAFANRSFREKFGEANEGHCYEYCFGLGAPCEFCESFQVLKTGKPHHREVKVPDGSIIDAWDFPFTDMDGSPMILKMVTDITANRRTEEALRAERQRFNDVLDILPAYVILLTPDYHVPFANRFFETRFGKAEGRRCFEYLFGRTEPCEICETFSVLKTRQPHEWEWTGPDGRNYYIFDFLFTDAEGADFILEMGLDITEKKRTAEELAMHRDHLEELVKERSLQIEAAYNALESFSYSVSHDLRAPLRAIDGYSRMILKASGERFDAETRRQFQIIRDSTRKMGNLIDDLLAFAKSGQQELKQEKLDMDGLARDVWAELLSVQTDRKPVLKISGMPAAQGDPAMIRQVLSNLLGNAVKFTRRNDAAVIEVGGCQQDGETVYHVGDNGVGFDMQFNDNLFGVFRRLHSDEDFEGTGIGLALVKKIIDRHGGRVWAEGKVDDGATFYFTLPTPRE